MSTMNRFPTGGGSSDIATAEPNNVLKGYTFVGKDSDDIQTGTLELTGNAIESHVIKGATFYNTDAKTKVTGIMEVGNVSNLNLAVSSGRNITVTWSNPTQTTGRPYSGVYVKYSTSGNPGTGGTQIYKGTGNNTTSGGRSSVTLGFPNLGTRYYISVYSYCVTSNGELIGSPIQGNIVSGSTYIQTITSSRNVTVPSGYSQCDIFCVGGGGGGAYGWYSGGSTSKYFICTGGGGGGGYTATASNISISSGQILACTIGSGGTGGTDNNRNGNNGGITKVVRSGNTLCTANGGNGGKAGESYSSTPEGQGGDGGSGGGDGQRIGRWVDTPSNKGGNGGTNGGKGYDGFGNQNGGAGQGRTTRPFGEGSGTIYSGGGGGGGAEQHTNSRGYGGGTGGGSGGYAIWNGENITEVSSGTSGSTNTGGGGGGGGSTPTPIAYSCLYSGNGGSGIILIRFK